MPAVDNDMDLSVLFPSEYLKCDDLKGKQVTVTISRVVNDLVPMSGGKKRGAGVWVLRMRAGRHMSTGEDMKRERNALGKVGRS